MCCVGLKPTAGNKLRLSKQVRERKLEVRESPARAGVTAQRGHGDICHIPSVATEAPKNNQRGKTKCSEGMGFLINTQTWGYLRPLGLHGIARLTQFMKKRFNPTVCLEL